MHIQKMMEAGLLSLYDLRVYLKIPGLCQGILLTELQIKRGNRDNFRIIFLSFPLKHILFPLIKTV